MKILFKKLAKVHPAKKVFYFLSLLLYLASLIYFIFNLLHFNIETLLRVIIIAIGIIWLFVYLLSGLLTMIAKKNKTFIFLTILTMLCCPIFFVGSYAMGKVYGYLNMVQKELKYTTNLIALKDTKFKSTSIIGMIESENDIEGNKLAKKLIKKNSLTNKVEYYEDYHSLISALYQGEIDACFVSSNYAIIFGNEKFESDEGEEETPIGERVKVIYEHSENMQNQDVEILSSSKNKKLTEPFTVLIMGVDSAADGLKANQAFNGDTLIMVTFNPTTLTATMFSIPRDMYVPIACNHKRYNKINSSAGYGSSCVINTVQQLTGIEIDYYVKMNFTGVVQLIDALGGVTVDVEEPDFAYDKKHIGQVCEQNSKREFSDKLVCVKPGVQTLNGEEALAYARCRHLYATSDIARNQHQQQIIEAAAQKLKTIRSLEDFEKILDAVSNNLETNITPEQIMSFYEVGKDMLLSSNENSTALSIRKTYLAYYSLPIYQPWSGRYTSALGYYPGSLKAITDLMKENLGKTKAKPVKSFNISYNEDYTTPLVGFGITTGEKLERMPNLLGKEKYEVENWCAERGITCTFNEVKNTAPAGQIISQDQYEGVLLKPIKSIKFEYSNGEGKLNIEIEKEEQEEEEESTNTGTENENEETTPSTGENNNEETEPTTPTEPTPNPNPIPTPEETPAESNNEE